MATDGGTNGASGQGGANGAGVSGGGGAASIGLPTIFPIRRWATNLIIGGTIITSGTEAVEAVAVVATTVLITAVAVVVADLLAEF